MIRRRLRLVTQVASADCGAAALAMVLPALGVPVGAHEVRERLDAGRDGVSALDIREAAIAYGVPTRAFNLPMLRSDPARLRHLPMPWIAHWAGDHFVVVERVGRSNVHLLDPALGRRRLRLADAALGFTGVVLLFEPATRAAKRPPSATRTFVAPMLWAHRWLLAALVGVSVGLTALAATVPAATAVLVDALAGKRAPGTGWLFAALALAVATAGLAWLRAVVTAWLQLRLGRRLTAAAVERLLAAAYRYFERRSQGDLINRLASATAIRELLTGALVGVVLDGATALAYQAVLAVLAPPVALAAAVLGAAQLGLVMVLTVRARGLQREELHAQGQESAQLLDAVASVAAIRTSGTEALVYQRWGALYDRASRAAQRRAVTFAGAESVMAAVSVAAPLLLLLVAAGSGASVGEAVGLAALAGSVVAAAGALSGRLFALAELGPLVDRLADVLRAPAEQPARRPVAPRLRGRVTLDNVGFRYDRRSPFALRGLSLTAGPGMKVAVVGASGSGKSTLTKLLAGLHPPTEGHIRYDGRDLAALDLRSVRQQLGVVLQEPCLGTGTIREAIIAGRRGATDRAAERAARLAAIHDEIAALPLGYQTPVGDGGSGLSGGQRQRIALARALIGEPVVLILDEATSALDPATEARVEASLSGLPMTRIVIAHRLSTIDGADLVVVLDHGVVVEQGHPSDLLCRGGRYADLVRLARTHSGIEPCGAWLS